MKTTCHTNNLIKIVRSTAKPHEKSEVNPRGGLMTYFSFADQEQNFRRVAVVDRILPGHSLTIDAMRTTQRNRTGRRDVMRM
jgi:hypothetical protein